MVLDSSRCSVASLVLWSRPTPYTRPCHGREALHCPIVQAQHDLDVRSEGCLCLRVSLRHTPLPPDCGPRVHNLPLCWTHGSELPPPALSSRCRFGVSCRGLTVQH